MDISMRSETHCNPVPPTAESLWNIEDEAIEKEDVPRHAEGIPLLTDLSPVMRTNPLALMRETTKIVTVIYSPAVTFAFPDVKLDA